MESHSYKRFSSAIESKLQMIYSPRSNEAWMKIKQWVNKNTTEKKTIKQCKEKTKNSKDQYKKAKQKNKKRVVQSFFSDFDEILHTRYIITIPELAELVIPVNLDNNEGTSKSSNIKKSVTSGWSLTIFERS